jgi:hypothetical protein
LQRYRVIGGSRVAGHVTGDEFYLPNATPEQIQALIEGDHIECIPDPIPLPARKSPQPASPAPAPRPSWHNPALKPEKENGDA